LLEVRRQGEAFAFVEGNNEDTWLDGVDVGGRLDTLTRLFVVKLVTVIRVQTQQKIRTDAI
jgi:hypothetical protein